MVVAKRLGRQPFLAEFVVVKFLQGMRFQLFKQDFPQHTKVLVEITAVAGIGGLFNGILRGSSARGWASRMAAWAGCFSFQR